MDLRQLEAFAAVVETGSFSKAAQKLFLTQPTVSAHVAALENELGLRLIDRTTKEARATRAGAALCAYAGEMLALRKKAGEAMAAFSRDLRGTVVVAASSIPDQYFLPKLIGKFREAYPEVGFELHPADSGQAVEMVQSRQAELGFTGTKPAGTKCLFQDFADDRLVIVTPGTKAYARFEKTGYPIRRILTETFISREPGSGTRRETENFLREMGVDPAGLKIAAEVGSTESIKQMVSAGLGVAVISRSAAEDYVQFGKLFAFDFDNIGLRRKLYIVRRRAGLLSPAAQAFYDFAKGFYREKSESNR